MTTANGQTEETVHSMNVQEKLRLLGVAEAGLQARRDALNVYLDLIRRIRRHVLLGTELEEATQRMDIPVVVGDTDRIISILAGHEALLAPPEVVQVERDPSRSRRDGRGSHVRNTRSRRPRGPANIRSGRGVRRQQTTGPVGPLSPRILRNAFIARKNPPETLEQILEESFGPGWGTKRVAMIRSGGRPEVMALSDDIRRGDDSILRRQIKDTAERCLRVAMQGDAGFPQERLPSQALRSLASDIGLPQRQSEVNATLANWGIPVEEPVAAG